MLVEHSEGQAQGADELARIFSVREAEGGWLARPVPSFGPQLFGGMLIGQAVAAAHRAAPAERRMHSLHAYFLRPGDADADVMFTVDPLRDGRSFTQLAVRAWQDGRQLLEMLCSFTTDGDGYEYQLPAVDTPEPEGRPPQPRYGPWELVRLGPTEPAPDGTRRSTSRIWVRGEGPLPDGAAVHQAVLGFFSDFTMTGGRPLHLEGDVRGLISLDHAVWFHRPVRADEWLLYDVHSLVNTAGRGVLRGAFYDRAGRLVASVAQEMIITPV